MDGIPDAAPAETRLADLRPTDRPVAILARLERAERREVVGRADGQRRWVLSGWLNDGTGTARFTWWDPPAEEIDAGTVLRAAPVSVREYRGRVELSFGARTRVAPASELELPGGPPTITPLSELTGGSEGWNVEARVIEVSERTIPVGAEPRSIREGLLADRSGLIAFTDWADLGLRAGEAVRLNGGYLGQFRGRRQLNLDGRTHVVRIDGRQLPDGSALAAFEARGALSRLAEGPGAERACVLGRALALSPPSGLVRRCGRCRRILREDRCADHGPVPGEPDLVARLVLDDGTGTVTVELARPLVESITGVTLAGALATAERDPEAPRTELFRRVFARGYRARGPLHRDDLGLTMVASTIEPAGPDELAGADGPEEARAP